MKRFILQKLLAWKDAQNRKPLVLKGVRQVGKTYIIKQFGANYFSKTHYVNFENNSKAAAIFRGDLQPRRIINELSFLLDTEINIAEDLVIFDEIQACPAALTSLKYFFEQLPELVLCCAGSLLGLHLNESSFPVGKVDLLLMHPMTFEEFLWAVEDKKSVDFLTGARLTEVPQVVHQHLWEQLKIYLVTGGLPEVVGEYVARRDQLYTALSEVRKKQNELIFGYYADIAKHAGKVNAMHIDRVLQAIPAQLARSQEGAASRFQFRDIIPGIDRYHRLASVIDWLLAAELIIKVPILEHVELPLKAYTKESQFKLYLFDVGILGAMSELPVSAILDYDYGTYKGYVAENFVAQELLGGGCSSLYSWQSQRAEVEFLLTHESEVIPVEVKSGWVTRNQSLNKYVEKYHPPYRVVLSAKTLNLDHENRYYHYPLYMASRIINPLLV